MRENLIADGKRKGTIGSPFWNRMPVTGSQSVPCFLFLGRARDEGEKEWTEERLFGLSARYLLLRPSLSLSRARRRKRNR